MRSFQKLGVVIHAYNPNTKLEEEERPQGPPDLISKR